MFFIQWNSSLDTGIEVIDNQHKRIVEYINELYTAVKEHDEVGIKHVLDELVDYTLTHFTFEENLMEKANYPYLEAHKQVHKSLIKRVEGYIKEFEQGQGEEVGRELLSVLRIWLTNHIKLDDMDYGTWVKQVTETKQHQSWLSKKLEAMFG